jgi:hypothetical protein
MARRTANSERRKNSRQTPPGLIYVEVGPGNGGMIRDLSTEGFALRAMMPVQPGAEIAFSFALNHYTRIEGHGKILWVEEQGRVAGIRFIDISVQAQALIQSWLDGTLENPEPEKPALTEAPSFAELREELRAPQQPSRETHKQPSAKPHWALPLPEKQEPAIPDREPSTSIPESKTLHQEETGKEQTELAQKGQTEPVAEPITFLGLPHFTNAQEPVEIRFEPRPAQQAAPPPAVETGNGVVDQEQINAQGTPVLPDISDILMQPPMVERASSWQPLEEMQEQAARSSWQWFTLSRAIGIMTLVALAVAFSVYHRAFGEGLVWLGQRMGANTETEAPTLPANDNVAPGETNSPGPSTPSQSTGAPAPSAGTTETNTESTHSLGATVPSLPETAKTLSPNLDAAASTEPNAGQETGSAEYAHALQLLHDKKRDADLSEAVRLLWISVEKGNPSAELTLAELYWRGQGVARNCDQTRILLSAAARKGNADAEKRLRQFEREGCE